VYITQAVITLRRQYRMAADIMAISNRLIYSGALLCGSQAVAQGRMALPGFPHALSAHRVPDWVMQVGVREAWATAVGQGSRSVLYSNVAAFQ
jgi:DNA replication ATP-dependent helicase Dna2